jgi:antitoxin Phd
MKQGTWSVADAKAKFSEVVERALTEGPQLVTRHGKPSVVVVSSVEWERNGAPETSLAEVLFDPSVRGLLSDEEIDTLFARDPDVGHPIDL